MTAVGGAHALVLIVGTGPAHEDRVVGMGFDVLLQILRTLEGLATEVTFVRLQRDMDTDVRSNVVTLDGSSTAGCPLARQVEVVGALATNMLVTDMFLKYLLETVLLAPARDDGRAYVENFWRNEAFTARVPPAD